MQVKDIMTRDVESITPDTPIDRIARKMRAADVGAFPVVKDGEVLGVITDRDIVIRGIAENGAAVTEKTADKVMSEGVLCCNEDQSLDDLKEQMETSRIRRVVVMDDSNRLVGMVSIGDLATREEHKAGRALREIARSSP